LNNRTDELGNGDTRSPYYPKIKTILQRIKCGAQQARWRLARYNRRHVASAPTTAAPDIRRLGEPAAAGGDRISSRQENCLLKERLGSRRIHFTTAEKQRLTRKTKALGHKVLRELETLVTPDTLLR